MSNSNSSYDVIIIGAGVAGAFAAYRAASYSGTKVLLIDLGRPPGKRRRQLEGWLGCFPGSDGKLFLEDKSKVSDLVDGRKLRHADKWVMDTFEQCGPMKVIKDKLPTATLQKKVINSGFSIIPGNYIQWKPEYVHDLSRLIAEELEKNKNIETSFDNEVYIKNLAWM
jgi:flavin-dependent dehydrogenase